MMNKDEFRKDSFSGVFSTERGYVQISEDFHGEGYHIETWDNLIGESQKVYLRGDEIFALAKAGVIANVFGITDLTDEVDESLNVNEERERELEKIRRVYSEKIAPLYGYEMDSEYDHYAVEGWGIHSLSDTDSETYKL